MRLASFGFFEASQQRIMRQIEYLIEGTIIPHTERMPRSLLGRYDSGIKDYEFGY